MLNLKYIPTKRTSFSLNPDTYELTDINITLKNILRDIVKVTIRIHDIRLKSNLNLNQTLMFTKKSFFLQL